MTFAAADTFALIAQRVMTTGITTTAAYFKNGCHGPTAPPF
jgi:hypothetical protein